MAIIKFTNSKHSLKGVLNYITKAEKTEAKLISGKNLVAKNALAEMQNVKLTFNKTDGRQYVHIVQSFDPEEALDYETAHQIGLQFADYFTGFQAVIATHKDRNHIHNHIVLNSVNFETGKKFHQNISEMDEVKRFSNQICQQFGLSQTPIRNAKRGLKQGEYNAAVKGDSWKFRLIKAIEEALERSTCKEDFIANMEYEGYDVLWSPNRKYITYTTPEGMKCRDNKLHDEIYLKENLEKLFEYRQGTGFVPMSGEPEEGWIFQISSSENQSSGGSVVGGLVSIDKDIENAAHTPPPETPHQTSESKQKQRERIKKLAQGHQISSDQEQDQSFTLHW